MAIDSAAKRASALGYLAPSSFYIVPDGTLDAADRATIAYLYGGVVLAGGAGAQGRGTLLWRRRRR